MTRKMAREPGSTKNDAAQAPVQPPAPAPLRETKIDHEESDLG